MAKKVDLGKVALDAGLVVGGGSLILAQILPMLPDTITGIVNNVPLDFMGIPVRLFLFGGLTLWLYRKFV